MFSKFTPSSSSRSGDERTTQGKDNNNRKGVTTEMTITAKQHQNEIKSDDQSKAKEDGEEPREEPREEPSSSSSRTTENYRNKWKGKIPG